MKIVSKTMIALGLLMGSGVCAMADTIWTFNDVVFNNGNEVTGWFATDPTTTIIDSFDIQVTGADSSDAFTAVQMPSAYLPSVIGIANADFSEYVDLYLVAPLTSAGGKILINQGYDCPLCGTLILNSDHKPSVTGVATPEPSSITLLGSGAFLIGFVSRRKLIR